MYKYIRVQVNENENKLVRLYPTKQEALLDGDTVFCFRTGENEIYYGATTSIKNERAILCSVNSNGEKRYLLTNTGRYLLALQSLDVMDYEFEKNLFYYGGSGSLQGEDGITPTGGLGFTLRFYNEEGNQISSYQAYGGGGGGKGYNVARNGSGGLGSYTGFDINTNDVKRMVLQTGGNGTNGQEYNSSTNKGGKGGTSGDGHSGTEGTIYSPYDSNSGRGGNGGTASNCLRRNGADRQRRNCCIYFTE